MKTAVWKVGKEGMVKEDMRLPANYSFHSPRGALAFIRREVEREIDQRQEQERVVQA